MRHTYVVAIAATAAAIGAAAATAATEWNWFVGDERAYVAGSRESPGALDNDLVLHALRDLNLDAGHIRMVSGDGNYELEHAPGTVARISPYVAGTPTKTSLHVGTATENPVTALVVEGRRRQTPPLQEWRTPDGVVAAIDARGRLVLRGVGLEVVVGKRAVRLVAVLPGNERVVLSTSRR